MDNTTLVNPPCPQLLDAYQIAMLNLYVFMLSGGQMKPVPLAFQDSSHYMDFSF